MDQELHDKLATLPEDIRTLIAHENVGAAIATIGEEHHISAEICLGFEDNVIKMLIGVEPLANLIPAIEHAGVTHGTAVDLARDIALEIFSPVDASLRKVQEISDVIDAIRLPANTDMSTVPVLAEEPKIPLPPAPPQTVQAPTDPRIAAQSALAGSSSAPQGPQAPTPPAPPQSRPTGPRDNTPPPAATTNIFEEKLRQLNQVRDGQENKNTDPYREPLV